MRRTYIVVMRDTDMWLQGPFDTTQAMREAGQAVQAEAGDDPRWQEISLPDGHPALVLLRD